MEQLLERIKNGVLVEDRHNAMIELQDIVAESRSAQLAFGATGNVYISTQVYIEKYKDILKLGAYADNIDLFSGLPIILAVLREERNDLDLVNDAQFLIDMVATFASLAISMENLCRCIFLVFRGYEMY